MGRGKSAPPALKMLHCPPALIRRLRRHLPPQRGRLLRLFREIVRWRLNCGGIDGKSAPPVCPHPSPAAPPSPQRGRLLRRDDCVARFHSPASPSSVAGATPSPPGGRLLWLFREILKWRLNCGGIDGKSAPSTRPHPSPAAPPSPSKGKAAAVVPRNREMAFELRWDRWKVSAARLPSSVACGATFPPKGKATAAG